MIVPTFRFQNGDLWWRDHRSSLREMRAVRAGFLAQPWKDIWGGSAELVRQIDDAIAAFEREQAHVG